MARARKEPAPLGRLPTDVAGLERLAFAIQERWHTMPATRLVIRCPVPPPSIRVLLRQAARRAKLVDARPPAPDEERAPSVGRLWRWREATFNSGKPIGFSLVHSAGPRAVALRGRAGEVPGRPGHIELLLAGPSAVRDAFELALSDGQARIVEREPGKMLRQRWDLPEPAPQAGRKSVRPPDDGQLLDPSVKEGIGMGQRQVRRGQLDADVERESDLILAALAEVGRLLAKARQREATHERNRKVDQVRARHRDSAERAVETMATHYGPSGVVTGDPRRRLTRAIEKAREDNRTPAVGSTAAEIYSEWGLYDRLSAIRPEPVKRRDDFGELVPPPPDTWPGLRQTIRRLRGGWSADDVLAFLLTIHERIATEKP